MKFPLDCGKSEEGKILYVFKHPLALRFRKLKLKLRGD
jgi:hypothetical protein